MRLLEELNRPRTVLIVAGLITLANVFLYLYSRGALSVGSASSEGTQALTTATTSSQMGEGEYSGKVEEIQDGSVETISEINAKLRRYDSLTADDVADLRARYQALSDYKNQAEGLTPPEKYADQYEAFRTAIGELYDAAGIAYKVSSDPVSAKQADFAEYERHVDSATDSLQQSNELLGQNYKTTEGLPRVAGL